jgi:hypothetical protein
MPRGLAPGSLTPPPPSNRRRVLEDPAPPVAISFWTKKEIFHISNIRNLRKNGRRGQAPKLIGQGLGVVVVKAERRVRVRRRGGAVRRRLFSKRRMARTVRSHEPLTQMFCKRRRASSAAKRNRAVRTLRSRTLTEPLLPLRLGTETSGCRKHTHRPKTQRNSLI